MMLKSDMNTVQLAPPNSISTERTIGVRNSAKLKMIAANVAVASESIVSVENLDRVRCSTTTPIIAPTPKNPSRNPYVSGLLLSSLAAVGKSAQNELVKKIRHADRTSSVRIPG